MQPHQLRVLEEKAELDIKLSKLHEFLTLPTFTTLAQEEQERLHRQVIIMKDYAAVLQERIEAFV